MRNFDIVVAADNHLGIGKDGGLPWHLPEDLAYFKRLTATVEKIGHKNAVIMGRKTWDSIPAKFRPLKDRLNIVLTRTTELNLPDGVLVAASLDQALVLADRAEIEKVFVIGGGAVYGEAIAHASCGTLYITQINATFDCDTRLPNLDGLFEQEKEKNSATMHENGIDYVWQQHRRTMEPKLDGNRSVLTAT